MMAKQNYTAKQQQAYHNKQSKVGAKGKDGNLLSDFARGYHKAKADEIVKQRKRAWNYHNKNGWNGQTL